MSLSVNIFFVLLLLIAISMSFAGIKIILNKFFNFDYQSYLWIQYSLFYMIFCVIFLVASFYFPYNLIFKVVTIIGFLVAETAIFYFRYYVLDSKLKYAVFLVFSVMVNVLLFQFVFIIFYTMLALRFA
jgi:hypothetical protein